MVVVECVLRDLGDKGYDHFPDGSHLLSEQKFVILGQIESSKGECTYLYVRPDHVPQKYWKRVP